MKKFLIVMSLLFAWLLSTAMVNTQEKVAINDENQIVVIDEVKIDSIVNAVEEDINVQYVYYSSGYISIHIDHLYIKDPILRENYITYSNLNKDKLIILNKLNHNKYETDWVLFNSFLIENGQKTLQYYDYLNKIALAKKEIELFSKVMSYLGNGITFLIVAFIVILSITICARLLYRNLRKNKTINTLDSNTS